MSSRGGCLCGAVRYEVTAPLDSISICHCSVCRRVHGEAAAYTRCAAEALVLVEARGLAHAEKDGATYSFCRECGSQLFWRRPERGTVGIAAGSLAEPTGLAIRHHIWVDSAADWELISDDLPRYPEGSPRTPPPGPA